MCCGGGRRFRRRGMSHSWCRGYRRRTRGRCRLCRIDQIRFNSTSIPFLIASSVCSSFYIILGDAIIYLMHKAILYCWPAAHHTTQKYMINSRNLEAV